MLTPYRRNLFAVIVTMTGATFSYSCSYPLIGPMLERRGYDSTSIGLNTAVEAVSIFAVVWSLGVLLGPPAGGFGLDLAPVFGLPAAMTLMVLPILPVAVASYVRRRR